ncbi:hypothetical protein H3019_gp04 [Bacillus phage Karezi]|uniref:Uncharacterized protein n=1 Tax=Bacillus phage Karezi TaxID=2591398 RepID=A0A514AAR5_9CAUD|nr:hypothetical protein H3019_gp04 [Bacillus phage Karezi]QDH50357.1 hypothetical protein KAREZI_4 [Bacillus phage Karezi]
MVACTIITSMCFIPSPLSVAKRREQGRLYHGVAYPALFPPSYYIRNKNTRKKDL